MVMLQTFAEVSKLYNWKLSCQNYPYNLFENVTPQRLHQVYTMASTSECQQEFKCQYPNMPKKIKLFEIVKSIRQYLLILGGYKVPKKN